MFSVSGKEKIESKVGINTPNVLFLRKNQPGISSQTVGQLTEFSQVNPKSCAKKVVFSIVVTFTSKACVFLALESMIPFLQEVYKQIALNGGMLGSL